MSAERVDSSSCQVVASTDTGSVERSTQDEVQRVK